MVRYRPVLPALAVTVLLFGGALAGAVRTSVAPLPGRPATLDAWRRVLTDPQFHEAVGFTVTLAVVATVLSVAVALPLTAALRRRRTVQALVTLPVLVPHLLMAVVVVLWLGPGGLADRLVGDIPPVLDVVRASSGAGVVLVYLLKEVPFLVLLLLSVWDDGVDQRLEVAATLGVGPVRALTTVVWPAVRAPLVLGAAVVMAFVVGFLQVPAVVGPNSPTMLPVYAIEATRVRGLAGQADAAVALLVASGMALALATVAGLAARRLDGVRGASR